MATLTTDQLLYLRDDIGDDGTVFTDNELNRNYTRADGDYNKAVVITLRQLLAQSAKLHDYRIAQSSESLSQVYKQVKGLLDYWESQVVRASQQVRIVGARTVPPRYKERPSTLEDWETDA